MAPTLFIWRTVLLKDVIDRASHLEAALEELGGHL